MRPLLPCALAVALVIATSPLHAQVGPPSAHDRTAANALFDAGRALAAAGRYDEACQRFRDSLAIIQRLGVLLNLADCLEHRGKTASAWTLFTDAAALARASGDERAAYAEERAAALAPRLVHLTIVAEGSGPLGLEARWDQTVVPAASFGFPIAVDPGTYRVVVAAPGHQPHELDVTAGPDGAHVEVRVPALRRMSARRPASTAPRPALAAAPRRWPVRVATWGAAGLGVVSIVAGGALGWSARSAWQDAEPGCRGDLCSDEAYDGARYARRLGDAATVAFAVGGVALTTALVLHLTTDDDDDRAPRVAPTIDADTALLTVSGRF